MTEHDTEELLANAIAIKNKSKLTVESDDYLLIVIKGGINDGFKTRDSSHMGIYWLTRPDSVMDTYMIFGPTEGQRDFGDNQQKIINHFCLSQHKKVRVYITKSLVELIAIIHAKVVKFSSERGGIDDGEGFVSDGEEEESFGLLAGRDTSYAISISNKDLSVFSIVVQEYLERVC